MRKTRHPIEIGKAYGNLIVISLYGKKEGKLDNYWNCKCLLCGNIKPIRASRLNEGILKSCGCKAHPIIHGLSKSTEYHIWQNMRERCNNENHPAYINYGGRGIKVCKKWDESFECFYAEMGPRPSLDHSIERINNDFHYTASNCKWDIEANQSRNRRNTRKILYNGENKCLKDWAILLNIHPDCLRARLNNGWAIEKAFFTPVRISRVRKI